MNIYFIKEDYKISHILSWVEKRQHLNDCYNKLTRLRGSLVLSVYIIIILLLSIKLLTGKQISLTCLMRATICQDNR